MDAFAWAEDAKERPKAEFGDRLRFVEIREATPEEWALLPDFTYEAIFKRPEDGFVPRTVLQHPALKGYITRASGQGRSTAAWSRWRTGPWLRI